jgi:hypothetical protein
MRESSWDGVLGLEGMRHDGNRKDRKYLDYQGSLHHWARSSTILGWKYRVQATLLFLRLSFKTLVHLFRNLLNASIFYVW